MPNKPFPKNAPSIKDAKPKTSTPVKYYPGLGIAPKIAKAFDSNFKNQT